MRVSVSQRIGIVMVGLLMVSTTAYVRSVTQVVETDRKRLQAVATQLNASQEYPSPSVLQQAGIASRPVIIRHGAHREYKIYVREGYRLFLAVKSVSLSGREHEGRWTWSVHESEWGTF